MRPIVGSHRLYTRKGRAADIGNDAEGGRHQARSRRDGAPEPPAAVRPWHPGSLANWIRRSKVPEAPAERHRYDVGFGWKLRSGTYRRIVRSMFEMCTAPFAASTAAADCPSTRTCAGPLSMSAKLLR